MRKLLSRLEDAALWLAEVLGGGGALNVTAPTPNLWHHWVAEDDILGMELLGLL